MEPHEPALHLQRPCKNFILFNVDEQRAFTPVDIFNGCLGDLPLWMGVTTGYDPEDPSLDPYMRPFESQEIVYAFQRRSQSRVLLRDSHNNALSLPVLSPLTFTTRAEDDREVTLTQILAKKQLPVILEFARPAELEFTVDGQRTDQSFFGCLLLTKVYEEPYMLCLSISSTGKVNDCLSVLPRNLYDVTFAPVVGVKGAADPKVKVQEFKDQFDLHIQQLDLAEHDDFFFKDLAFVQRGGHFLEEVEPYIEQDTFIRITRTPSPSLRTPPRLPPRNPLRRANSALSMDSKKIFPMLGRKTTQDSSPMLGRKIAPASSPMLGMKQISSSLPKMDGAWSETEYNFYEAESQSKNDDENLYMEPEPYRCMGPGPARRTRVVHPFLSGPAEGVEDLEGNSGAGVSVGRDSFFPLPPVFPLPTPVWSPNSSPFHIPPASSNQRRFSVDEGEYIEARFHNPTAHSKTVKSHQSDQEDVTSLGVDDVAGRLKDLGLGKYARKFRKNRIDGVLLKQLVIKEALKAEFQMSGLEVLRLATFVNEGHIPKSAKK